MTPITSRGPRRIRHLAAGAVALVLIGLTFGGQDGAITDRVSGAIGSGVRQAGNTVEECRVALRRFCEIAEGSIRLLARIDREVVATPAGACRHAPAGPPPRALPTAVVGRTHIPRADAPVSA